MSLANLDFGQMQQLLIELNNNVVALRNELRNDRREMALNIASLNASFANLTIRQRNGIRLLTAPNQCLPLQKHVRIILYVTIPSSHPP